jgi:hypothetical protein
MIAFVVSKVTVTVALNLPGLFIVEVITPPEIAPSVGEEVGDLVGA